MVMTVYIYTFGCQMNVHDSEKMLGVCKKPDKKYKEKLEKYNRLFSLARKDK